MSLSATAGCFQNKKWLSFVRYSWDKVSKNKNYYLSNINDDNTLIQITIFVRITYLFQYFVKSFQGPGKVHNYK